jgi:hypothetical protein
MRTPCARMSQQRAEILPYQGFKLLSRDVPGTTWLSRLSIAGHHFLRHPS